MSLEDKANSILAKTNSYSKAPITFSIIEVIAVVSLIIAAIKLIKACSKTTEEEHKTLTKLNLPGRRRLKQLVRERPPELRHINADYLEKALLEEARQTDLTTYTSLLKSCAEYQP
jgi:predicted ATP-dependent Lon-type protease